jgi:DNA-binding NarL/FixJ family response regulator
VLVSESADAVRRRVPREAARRRELVNLLNIAEAGCRYSASVLANGAGPAEARGVAVEMAAELSMVAEALRRLTRLGPAERRVRAAELVGAGWTRRQAAVQLGISERAVRNYLRPR